MKRHEPMPQAPAGVHKNNPDHKEEWVMIPTEIVFITMPPSTDFTGPIIGIVGVLIGSAFGIYGLRWQHHAQREYDIRKIAANLLAAGEEIRECYIDRKSSALHTNEMQKVLDFADAKLNEMYRHLRHLELVAGLKVVNASESFLTVSSVYHSYIKSLYGAGEKPSEDALAETYQDWDDEKEGLIAMLNKKRGKVGK